MKCGLPTVVKGNQGRMDCSETILKFVILQPSIFSKGSVHECS